MSRQTPYNLNESTLSSLASNVGNQLKKAAKFVGKQESAKAKEAAIAQAEQELAKTAASTKRAATRKRNATPKPGRMSGSKGIDARPTGLPPIKPVVLNRQQHFESAVGNAKDTSASRATTPKVNYSAADAYND